MTSTAKQQFMKALAAATIKEVEGTSVFSFEDVVCITIAEPHDLDFEPEPDEVYILELASAVQRSEHRYGSRAMALLGALADQFNVTLSLNALSIGKDGVPMEKLRAFYGKQGFECVEATGSFMRRAPRSPA